MNNVEAQAIFLLRDNGLDKAVMVASGLACRSEISEKDKRFWAAVSDHLDNLLTLNPEQAGKKL